MSIPDHLKRPPWRTILLLLLDSKALEGVPGEARPPGRGITLVTQLC
jgi:hypothetical protein